MRFRQIILISPAVLLSAIVVAFLLTLPALLQIEENWNIVVVAQMLTLARVTLLVCLAHALLLGLPLILLLRAINRLGILSCAIAGLFVGAMPLGAVAFIAMLGPHSASIDGRPTVVNGVPTLAGWMHYARTVGFLGLIGVIGGLIFWALSRLSWLGTGSQAQSRLLSWGVGSVAVIMTGALLILPTAVKDNSCHNLFRDGRTSIGPQISGDLKIPTDEWARLEGMFRAFGSTHALSFRRDEAIRHGSLMWRSLSLCNEAGVTIHATDQPWLKRTKFPLADRGIELSIFELKRGSEWERSARDLLANIDSAWPQSMTFRGRDGKIISREEALKGRP